MSTGKACFGTIRKNNYASDYTNKLTGEIIYCNAPKHCNQIARVNSYEEKNLYNKVSQVNCPSISRTNLVAGLYTKEDLADVTTVCDVTNSCCSSLPYTNNCTIPATTIVPTNVPFYEFYKIDPNGKLFGNSECGIYNYTRYMVLNSK